MEKTGQPLVISVKLDFTTQLMAVGVALLQSLANMPIHLSPLPFVGLVYTQMYLGHPPAIIVNLANIRSQKELPNAAIVIREPLLLVKE